MGASLIINNMGSTIPEMSRRVSTIEDQLCFGLDVFINPSCPGLQSSSVSFNSIEFWIKMITFFVIIYPVSTKYSLLSIEKSYIVLRRYDIEIKDLKTLN